MSQFFDNNVSKPSFWEDKYIKNAENFGFLSPRVDEVQNPMENAAGVKLMIIQIDPCNRRTGRSE